MLDHDVLTAEIHLHPRFAVGAVDRRLFGSFVEHLGRAVYTGLYEPAHPDADEHGFRTDVAALVREAGVRVVRYPGGNFVSGYRWEDGVGPRDQRPETLDLAWRTVEPNQVGTDDFLQWAARTGVEPMLAVNLGTRGAEEAAALVEYCNGQPGTRWADLRAANGHPEPYGVRLWCLGNEMDGPWQLGHKSPEEYGRVAAAAALAMKRVAPDIELVLCGSTSTDMQTFGEWERVVLEHTYHLVDHISTHAYYEERDGDRASFLASGTAMDRSISRVLAWADAMGAALRSDKRLTISFDEWNVWYVSRFGGEAALPVQRDAPRIIEDAYSAVDAVVVGDLLITLVNHADRVPIACLAQLVNVIAPIMTEPGGPAWRQTTFHPFATTARLAHGVALDLRIDAPAMPTQQHGEVPTVTAAATWLESTGALSLFLVNRSETAATVTVRHPGCAVEISEGLEVRADSQGARHGRTAVESFAPRSLPQPDQTDSSFTVTLAPQSWTAWSGTAEVS